MRRDLRRIGQLLVMLAALLLSGVASASNADVWFAPDAALKNIRTVAIREPEFYGDAAKNCPAHMEWTSWLRRAAEKSDLQITSDEAKADAILAPQIRQCDYSWFTQPGYWRVEQQTATRVKTDSNGRRVTETYTFPVTVWVPPSTVYVYNLTLKLRALDKTGREVATRLESRGRKEGEPVEVHNYFAGMFDRMSRAFIKDLKKH